MARNTEHVVLRKKNEVEQTKTGKHCSSTVFINIS